MEFFAYESDVGGLKSRVSYSLFISIKDFGSALDIKIVLLLLVHLIHTPKLFLSFIYAAFEQVVKIGYYTDIKVSS